MLQTQTTQTNALGNPGVTQRKRKAAPKNIPSPERNQPNARKKNLDLTAVRKDDLLRPSPRICIAINLGSSGDRDRNRSPFGSFADVVSER
jgi:hypothetical protein